ncbi:MAG: hypothetical protein M3H12_03205, partial [Chromatiales bacterium]
RWSDNIAERMDGEELRGNTVISTQPRKLASTGETFNNAAPYDPGGLREQYKSINLADGDTCGRT